MSLRAGNRKEDVIQSDRDRSFRNRSRLAYESNFGFSRSLGHGELEQSEDARPLAPERLVRWFAAGIVGSTPFPEFREHALADAVYLLGSEERQGVATDSIYRRIP